MACLEHPFHQIDPASVYTLWSPVSGHATVVTPGNYSGTVEASRALKLLCIRLRHRGLTGDPRVAVHID